MATSGTTAFTLTRDQIIQYALRKTGVLALGVTPDATEVANAAIALDMLIKSWITKGIKLWTLQELTIPLQANKTTYTVGPTGSLPTPDVIADKPMKLLQAFLRNVSATPNNDIPLMLISQEQYLRFGSKFSTGTSNSLYMYVGRDNSTINLYLTPSVTAASLFQLHVLVPRPLQDAGVSTNNLDFPTEWLYALGWNLAAEIATDYGVEPERLSYIESKAAKFLTEVEDFDTEYNSIYFAPSFARPSV